MVYLSEEDLLLILISALLKAKNMSSDVGNKSPRIHVAMQGVGRSKPPSIVFSHEEADESAKSVARQRAHLAEHHSSDKLAVSSYGAAMRSGSKSPTDMAGGVPLYKQGKLVGSLAISGDSPRVDEAIAHAASKQFQAPSEIRSDKVIQTPFLSDSAIVQARAVEFLPNARNSLYKSQRNIDEKPRVLPPSPRSIKSLRETPKKSLVLPPSPRNVKSLRGAASPKKSNIKLPLGTNGQVFEMPSMRSSPPPTPAALSRVNNRLPPSPRGSSLSSSVKSLSPVQLPPSPRRSSVGSSMDSSPSMTDTAANVLLPPSPVIETSVSSPYMKKMKKPMKKSLKKMPPSPRKLKTLPKL